MKNKFLEIIKKKWLRSVTLTIVLFAIIICAYLGIVYGITALHLTDLDFTKEKIYSISQATKDRVEKIDQDITISIYNMYEYIEDLAYKYASVNNHIKVEKVDNLTTKTEWKTNYGVTDESQFVIIETESKSKILYESNFYTMDFTTYQQIDVTEEAITNAILDVTTNVKPKICFLTGHEYYSQTYFQYLQSDLEAEINEIEFIDLLKTGSIPEDCKLLAITALKEDITERERDLILDYIQEGGELLLLLDANLDKIQMPNFNKILEEYGVSISEGFILEGDNNRMVYGSPSFVVAPIYENSQIVKNMSMGLNVCMMNPAKLTIASEEELEEKNITMEVLATVSDKAFYRTDLNSESTSKIESDEDAGGATIAAMLTKDYGEDKKSKIIIFTSSVFATNTRIRLDEQNYRYALDFYNNKDVLLNSVSYLTDREDNITIRKTVETVTTYDLSEAQLRTICIIIFAIPIFIILMGIVVWQIRRRKK